MSNSSVIKQSQGYLSTMPVGSILAWHRDLLGAGLPLELPPGWASCDGQVLNDPESILHGQQLPNLNGEKRFLRGGNVSGVNEADQMQSHAHSDQGHTHTDSGHYHTVDGINTNPPANTPLVDGKVFSKGTGQKVPVDFSTNPDHSNIQSARAVLGNPIDSQTGAGAPRIGNETHPANMSIIWIMKVKLVINITADGVVQAHEKAGMGSVYVDETGNVGIGVTQPRSKLDVKGKIWADDMEIKNDLIVKGKIYLRSHSSLEYNWEYEHVIIRGIQGGGYGGQGVLSTIHQAMIPTETTSVVPGNPNMTVARSYGAGVSGRKHGYFFKTDTDKFVHATNSITYLSNRFQLFSGSYGYTFTDEVNEKCFAGTGSNCDSQLKINNSTDSSEWVRSNGLGWSGGSYGGGGFYNEMFGWAANGANINTLRFAFATEVFSNRPGGVRQGGDSSILGGELNTRKGYGFIISSLNGIYQNRVDKFNFANEVWSQITNCSQMMTESHWHGGELKGVMVGGYFPGQAGKAAIMTYSSETVAMAPHMDIPVSRCSNCINNAGV
jgi:hypothetical protein